jgi:hypothetical protein
MYQALTDCSTHLGNSLTATGNAELSNKMVSHMSDQKVFLIKTIYSFGASHVAVVRQYHWEFYVHVVPSRDTTCWIVKKSLKKQEVCVCVKNVCRETNISHLFVQHRRQKQKVQEKVHDV